MFGLVVIMGFGAALQRHLLVVDVVVLLQSVTETMSA